jgi:hypothetical protein
MNLRIHILGLSASALTRAGMSHNLRQDIPHVAFAYASQAATFLEAADDVYSLCNNPSREPELLGVLGKTRAHTRTFSKHDVVELEKPDGQSQYLVCASVGWRPCTASQFEALREAGHDEARKQLLDQWAESAPRSLKHPFHEDVTTETALEIARAIKYHPLPKPTDPAPSIAEAIELIAASRRSCGFNWITGRVSEEVLRLTRGEIVAGVPAPAENDIPLPRIASSPARLSNA